MQWNLDRPPGVFQFLFFIKKGGEISYTCIDAGGQGRTVFNYFVCPEGVLMCHKVKLA